MNQIPSILSIAIPLHLKNVVAAASLGHRGDTAFPPVNLLVPLVSLSLSESSSSDERRMNRCLPGVNGIK